MAAVVDENVVLIEGSMKFRVAHEGGYPLLSSLRASCVSHGGKPDLLPHLTTKGNSIIDQVAIGEERLTRPIRFTLGFSLMYFVRVPFGIHSDTNFKGFCVTPTKGTTLGCFNIFHIIASL